MRKSNYKFSKKLLSEFERCIENLDDYHDFFDHSTYSTLEFIKAFGINEFLKEIDDIRNVETFFVSVASAPYPSLNTNNSYRIRHQLIAIAEELLLCLDEFSDFLADYEFMDLEFIKAFGVREFVQLADDHVVEKLFNLCKLVLECEDIEESPVGISRYNSYHSRKQRRISKSKAKTHIIQLASDDIYLEKRKLVRKCGFICHKVSEAEANLRNYDEKKKESILLFSKIELKAFRKTIRKGKKYVKFAEKYEDHTIFYNGRYFTSMEKAIIVDEPDDVIPAKGSKNVYYTKLSDDCLDSKYRHSGLYIRTCGNTHDFIESNVPSDEVQIAEKEDVSMRVRRNKHHVAFFMNSNKVSKPKEKLTDDSGTPYIPINKFDLGIYHS